MRAALKLTLAGMLVLGCTAQAQTPPVHIRGTIRQVNQEMLTVITRDGPVVQVALGPKVTVATVRAVPLSDVDKGRFVGIAPPHPGRATRLLPRK